jgi:hypothetical protein
MRSLALEREMVNLILEAMAKCPDVSMKRMKRRTKKAGQASSRKRRRNSSGGNNDGEEATKKVKVEGGGGEGSNKDKGGIESSFPSLLGEDESADGLDLGLGLGLDVGKSSTVTTE